MDRIKKTNEKLVWISDRIDMMLVEINILRSRKTPEEIADKVWGEHSILGNIDHEAHCILDMNWEDFVEWIKNEEK